MRNRLTIYYKTGIAIMMIMILIVFTGCSGQVKDYKDLSFKEVETDEAYDKQVKGYFGFTKIAENEFLQLFIDDKTTEIKLYDKVNGVEIFSNPQLRNEDRLTLNVPSRNKMISQLNIDYDIDAGTSSYSTYTDSVEAGQYNFQQIENGIRIDYVVGVKPIIYLAPQILSIERREELRKIIKEEDLALFDRTYKLISLDNYPEEEDRALRRSQYPILAERDVYITNVSANPVEIGEYVYASKYLMTKLHNMFVAAGYTIEDLDRDDAENKVPSYREPDRTVTVSMIYKLDGDSLVVTVPRDSIYFDRDVLQVTNMTILPYFGAADESESGYMFVPDGSGALINLNNDKKLFGMFTKPVYGRDKLVYTDELTISDSMVPMPVFGIKTEDKAFLGIIEAGDAAATIIADISGKTSQNNMVYSKILINANSERSNQGLSSGLGKKYQTELISTDLTMRYYVLGGEEANYTGMAKKYRQYLLDHDKIQQQEIASEIPVSISTVQAIIKTKSIMGIPKEGILPLTTFDQTKMILEELKGRGVEDMILEVVNWSNNANLNTSFNKLKILKEIGGQSGFEELIQYTADNGIDFYPLVDFQYISRNTTFSGFNSRINASRMLDNTVGYDYYYDLNSLIKNRNMQKFIISPNNYSKMISSFIPTYMQYGNPFINIGTIGIDLNPDYNDKIPLDRQEALNIVQDQIQYMISNDAKLAVNGGNIYSVNGVSLIYDAPIKSSMQYICDETIPFYQMVLHGLVPYTGPILNMSSEMQTDLLKLIESGSYPAFRWMYEPNDVLTDTASNFYSINYQDWLDQAAEIYTTMNDALAGCAGSQIMNHTILQEGLVKVEYDNGTTIYVNYNDQKMMADGYEVEAVDYLVVGGANH